MANKHPTVAEKKRVEAIFDDFQYMFSIQNYDRAITYKTEPCPDGNFAAEIKVEEDYQRVTFYFYPSFWKYSRREQAEYILHEYCHLLTEPLTSLVDSLRRGELNTLEHRRVQVERSTSMITNLLDKLLRGGMRYAKKAYAKYAEEPKKKKKRHAKHKK